MSTPAPDEPVRILHVAQATVTGLAVYVSNLAAYQRSVGIDARIACPPAGSLAEWAARDGVPHLSWPATRQPGPSLPKEWRRLAAIIDEFDPHIVHLTSSKAGFVGRLVLRGRRPTVFSPQAWSFLVPGWTSALAARWEAFAGRWATQILVACEEEAEAGRQVGVRSTFAVAENGIDPDRFPYADEEAQAVARRSLGLDDLPGPIAVCVGRLSYQKGQLALLEAWELLRRACPEARLLLVGDGEDEQMLRAAAPEGVVFAGVRTDVPQWLAASDLAVHPSRYEGLSFAVLEALSVGRSVVAFDGIGMHAAIGTDAGAIVPMNDIEALADAVLERLRDRDLCRREGSAGRARVLERFTVDRMRTESTARTLEVLDPPPPGGS